ncbi:hypothetical protein AALC25_09615 [Lachnospiraceae bacterium 29-84]
MGNFDDLALAVASFGGHNKVILDDLGKPSIMVGVPKMKYSDVITGGTQGTLPWWIVEGVEKNVIWVSKYLNCVVNDRAYSLPMKDTKVYVNFDNALRFSRNKGEGWHLLQNGVFAALSLWSEKNGTIPRGNTNWDASYEKEWERGVNNYNSAHGGGRTATGSGPVTWNHDHSAAGIADLCGNCWEWVSGARSVNGEIQIIPYGNSMKSDCSMGEDSTEWKAIMPDGRLVEPGTAGTLKIDKTSASDGTLRINTSVTTQTTDNGSISVPFKDTEAVSGVSIPKILIAAGFFPDSGQKAQGRFWARNRGERLPVRGSSFDSTSDGGVAALLLNNTRSSEYYFLSFRSAFYE